LVGTEVGGGNVARETGEADQTRKYPEVDEDSTGCGWPVC
jgi:hypothetical protein